MLACIVTCGGLCPGLNTVIREIVHSLDYMYGVTKVLGIDVSWLFMIIIVSLESLCLDFAACILNYDTWSRPVRFSPERVFLQVPDQCGNVLMSFCRFGNFVTLTCQAYIFNSLWWIFNLPIYAMQEFCYLHQPCWFQKLPKSYIL